MSPIFYSHNPTSFDWKAYAEDMLIKTYVPDADTMTRAEALELAIQRDREAAQQIYSDLALDRAAMKARELQILEEIGF